MSKYDPIWFNGFEYLNLQYKIKLPKYLAQRLMAPRKNGPYIHIKVSTVNHKHYSSRIVIKTKSV